MAFSFDIYPHFLSDILSIMGMEFFYRVTIKTALTMFAINRFVKIKVLHRLMFPTRSHEECIITLEDVSNKGAVIFSFILQATAIKYQ